MIKVKQIVTLMIISISIYAQDYDPPGAVDYDYVPQICHMENMINFMKIQKELNLETMTDFDKMQFTKPIKSEMFKKDYFDAAGNHTSEIL